MGLVEQAELLLLNGLEQSLLQQHPPLVCAVMSGVEQIAVAATALGFMHGVVRRADEAVRGLAMLRIEGDADAGGEPHPLLADVGGIVQPALQPLDETQQILVSPDGGQQHQKFVCPQPDGDVSGRRQWRMRSADSLSSRSPALCPRLSLMSLKPSRSMNSSARTWWFTLAVSISRVRRSAADGDCRDGEGS